VHFWTDADQPIGQIGAIRSLIFAFARRFNHRRAFARHVYKKRPCKSRARNGRPQVTTLEPPVIERLQSPLEAGRSLIQGEMKVGGPRLTLDTTKFGFLALKFG
jgi:hypothetical protein